MSDGCLRLAGRFSEKPREACGVLGIWGKNTDAAVVRLCYLGLYALQHRGQEGAGIVTFDGERMRLHKGAGLVPEVFDEESLSELEGFAGIGHVRLRSRGKACGEYSASWCARPTAVWPLPNGSLLNGDKLREKLLSEGTVLQTDSDSEVILNLIAKSGAESLPAAVAKTLEHIEGLYALVILGEDMPLAARDPFGETVPLLWADWRKVTLLHRESCAITNLAEK